MALYIGGQKVCNTVRVGGGVSSIDLTSPNLQSDVPVSINSNTKIWAGNESQITTTDVAAPSGVNYYICEELISGSPSIIILSDDTNDIVEVGQVQDYYVGIWDNWDYWLTTTQYNALPEEDKADYDLTTGYRPVIRNYYNIISSNNGTVIIEKGGTAKLACLANSTLTDSPIRALDTGKNFDSIAIADSEPISDTIFIRKSITELNPDWVFAINDVGIKKGDTLLCPMNGISIPREISSNGVYQMPSSSFTFSLPSNATDIGSYAMSQAFYYCSSLTSADLSSLTTVSSTYAMNSAFRNCSSLTSVDLSSLTTVSGDNAMTFAFQSCSSLASVDLSSLTTVSGPYAMSYVFYSCASLTSLDFPSLTTVSGTYAMNQAFYSCTSLTSVDLSSLTTVSGTYAMYQAFRGCTSLTSLDLSSLTTVSGSQAMNYTFQNCTSLTSLDLSSLTTVSGTQAMNYTFQNCPSLTSVDLSALTTVSGTQAMNYTFHSCTSLTSVNFSSLQTIGTNSSSTNYGHFYQAFYNCTNLATLTFPELTEIYCTYSSASYGTFYNNNKVKKMYFPKLSTITYGTGASSSNQTAAKNIFYNCTSLTELHFGAANQAAIEASPGYSTAWGRGAGNVTIYFDL